jgi:hypothetical protein
MAGWISADDRKPPLETPVLVWNGRWCRVCETRDQYGRSFFDCRTNQHVIPKPTHWMPLPEPPHDLQSNDPNRSSADPVV